MSNKLERLNKADMTADQRACFDLLCALFLGEHHVPTPIYEWGRGIKCSVASGKLATFDFDGLTRLVLLAHDRCIRAELVSSGPRMVGIVLHKRAGREGSMNERHPTMDEAIGRLRK